MITSDRTVPRHLAVTAVVGLAVIALTGCGGSPAPKMAKATARTPTTGASQLANVATTLPAPSREADERIAEESSLRLSDFPTGWEQKNTTAEAETNPCAAIDHAKATASAVTRSPDFDKGTAASVHNATYIYRSIGDAKHAFIEISSNATRTCLAKVVAHAAAKGKNFTLGEITTRQVSIGELGDERAASQFTIPIRGSGLSLNVNAEIRVVRANRGVAVVTFVHLLTPLADGLKDKLTTTVVHRLTTGLDAPGS